MDQVACIKKDLDEEKEEEERAQNESSIVGHIIGETQHEYSIDIQEALIHDVQVIHPPVFPLSLMYHIK